MKQKWPRRDGLNTFCVAWSLCQISPTSVGSSLELSKPLASLQATSCWGGLHARSSCRNNRRHRGWLQWSRTTAYPSSAPDSSRTSPLMEGDSSFPKWRLFEKITMRDYISLGSHVRKKPTPLGDAYTRESRYQSLLLPPNDTSDEDWLSASLDLANSLGIDPASATETQHRRVFHLYLPVYFWLRQLLLSGRHRPNDGVARSSATSSPSSTQHQVERYTGECGHNALVVGISAPQGCGKSTLVEEMRRMLVKAKHPCSVLSIDDFYLTGSEQVGGEKLIPGCGTTVVVKSCCGNSFPQIRFTSPTDCENHSKMKTKKSRRGLCQTHISVTGQPNLFIEVNFLGTEKRSSFFPVLRAHHKIYRLVTIIS